MQAVVEQGGLVLWLTLLHLLLARLHLWRHAIRRPQWAGLQQGLSGQRGVEVSLISLPPPP